jgi:hypothetical protein
VEKHRQAVGFSKGISEMSLKEKFAKGWEWAGHLHLATWIAQAIVAQWNAIIPGAVAFATAYWASASRLGYLEVFLVTIGVFTSGIWAINGMVWLRRQARPSREHIAFDYAYALALEEIAPSLDLNNLENTLELRPKFRNVANGPMRVLIDRMDVRLEDRFYQARIANFVIPRAVQRTVLTNFGFRREAFDAFPSRARGTIELSILYGHPEDRYSRRSTKILRIDVFKGIDPDSQQVASITVNWIVEAEDDVAA